jgi:hypothetical protein
MTGRRGPKNQAPGPSPQALRARESKRRAQENMRRALQSMLDKRLAQLRAPAPQRGLTLTRSGGRSYAPGSQGSPWTLKHGAANRTDAHISRAVFGVYVPDAAKSPAMHDRVVTSLSDYTDGQWSKTSVLLYHSYPHHISVTTPAMSPFVLAEAGATQSADVASLTPRVHSPASIALYRHPLGSDTTATNRANRDPDVRWSQRVLTSHLRVTITGGHSLRGIFSWQPVVADWTTLMVHAIPRRIAAEVHTVHRKHFAGSRTVIDIPLFLCDPALYGRMSRMGTTDETSTHHSEIENVDPWGTICAVFEELAWATTDPAPRIEVVCTEKIQSELPSSEDHLDNSATHAIVSPERAPPVTKDRVRPPKQTAENPNLRGGAK